jgi:hypothetical protein
VIRRSDGIPEGLVLRAERTCAKETRDESSLVCNFPDVVRLRVVVCAGRSRAEADGPPPISCSPITSATSEPRRASSLRIVTQNLECDVQECMQRVSAPLISSPFRWNIAGATPIGIVARGTGLRARGLGSRVAFVCRPGLGSLPGAYCALVRFSSSASIAASPLTAFSRARTSASGSRSKSLTRPARYSSRSSSKVPTEANGWRSTARRSIARLVPQPGREASSHGPPAQLLRDSAARLRNDGEKVYCLSQWVPFDHSIE